MMLPAVAAVQHGSVQCLQIRTGFSCLATSNCTELAGVRGQGACAICVELKIV